MGYNISHDYFENIIYQEGYDNLVREMRLPRIFGLSTIKLFYEEWHEAQIR